jgi:hypothetical protein
MEIKDNRAPPHCCKDGEHACAASHGAPWRPMKPPLAGRKAVQQFVFNPPGRAVFCSFEAIRALRFMR